MGLPLSTAVPDGGYCAGVKKLTLGAGALMTGMVGLSGIQREEEGIVVRVVGEQGSHLYRVARREGLCDRRRGLCHDYVSPRRRQKESIFAGYSGPGGPGAV